MGRTQNPHNQFISINLYRYGGASQCKIAWTMGEVECGPNQGLK